MTIPLIRRGFSYERIQTAAVNINGVEYGVSEVLKTDLVKKLQLHDAIYRLRFYSNLLIHILSLSNVHNNVAPIQKNQDDKSHRVIVALGDTFHGMADYFFPFK